MKKIIFGLILIAAASSCKDKYVWCEDIGNNIKSWSVYELGDSISMHDQFGNAVVFQISKYNNKPAYQMKESRGLMKKMAYCKGDLSIASDTNYFSLYIESSSSERGETRKPDEFSFNLSLGDLTSTFATKNSNEVSTVYTSDPYAVIEYDYSVGNIVYPEAVVCEKDTISSNISVYRFVYAKDKGLVEFSTRNPARTYIVD